MKILPREQLLLVLGMGNNRDLFLAGTVENGHLVLIRGDYSELVVPLSIFRPEIRPHASTPGATPDFERFDINDRGRTIWFGDYCTSANFILWMADEGFPDEE